MHSSLFDHLACPACRTSLELTAETTDGADIITGTLSCPRCALQVPIAQGFALFTEADIEISPTQDWFGTPADYETYRQTKFNRDQLEIYAAFHPFNESVRAAEAVLPLFTAALKPGDLILDPWARTGWSGFWLAQRFPNQRIVMLVEGNRDVLGYRGVAHWLAQSERPENLDVLFVHPARGLPFQDASVAAVWSHDCLHRFPLQALAADLLRITTPTAPLVFAHVHLANSEPDPWFDRGCTIRHGQTYRHWLDKICKTGSSGGQRSGWIFSEADLFNTPNKLPPDSPDTSHYNGFILIAVPNEHAPNPEPQDTRYLLNPLYRLHLGPSTARIEPQHHNFMVGSLLERHPVYQNRLPTAAVPLTAAQWPLIAMALTGQTHTEIQNAFGAQTPDLLIPLTNADLLLSAPVSRAGLRMQRFHANQLPPHDPGLTGLLSMLKIRTADLRAGDGTAISGEQTSAAIEALAGALAAKGAQSRTSLKLALAPHPLALLLLLAGLRLGCDVSPKASTTQTDMIITDSLEPTHLNTQHIVMGWSNEPGSLIADIDSAPSVGIQPRGRLVIGALTLSADLLCEAALSLRHAAAPLAGAGFQLDSFQGVLACLIALGRDEALTVSI